MFNLDKSVWSRWEVVLLVFIIILCLVLGGTYASYAILFKEHVPTESEIVVNSGDTVTVDYIGMFEDGTVFDTSIESVGENNTQYPKSPYYTAKSSYQPLSFTVGAGQMIAGFDKGVIGMGLNQTKTITVTPEFGYGELDPTLIETKSIWDSVTVLQWFEGNTSDFINTYGVDAQVGICVKNPDYGWNMTVYHVEDNNILLKNTPFIGELVHDRNGLTLKVESIDSSANKGDGEILVKTLISAGDIGTKVFTDQYGNQFRITSYDKTDETFTMDFNREVVGKTLIFKVTVLTITPGQ